MTPEDWKRVIDEAAACGVQTVAATPGAEIVEVGDHGLRRAAWHELEVVDHFRRYLTNPHAYLRHVIPPE